MKNNFEKHTSSQMWSAKIKVINPVDGYAPFFFSQVSWVYFIKAGLTTITCQKGNSLYYWKVSLARREKNVMLTHQVFIGSNFGFYWCIRSVEYNITWLKTQWLFKKENGKTIILQIEIPRNLDFSITKSTYY